MEKQIQWRLQKVRDPNRRRGAPSRRKPKPKLVANTMRFEAAFLGALREYVANERARTGQQVSQPVVLATLALAHNSELRLLYDQHRKAKRP